MKNKLAFVTRAHFKKTKSDLFLIELLEDYFNLKTFHRSELDDQLSVHEINDFNPNLVVFFAKLPSVSNHLLKLKCKKIIIVPMYDGIMHTYLFNSWIKRFFIKLKNITFFTFSKKLQDVLIDFGLNSNYYTYFPKLKRSQRKQLKVNPPYDLFLWQRNNYITPKYLLDFFGEGIINKITLKKDSSSLVDFHHHHKVEYIGEQWFNDDTLDNYICNSDFFIAPRLQEGIGMSFLNAMSLLVPVVAIDDSTMNEYIVHNENGILIKRDESKFPLQNHSIKVSNITSINEGLYNKWMADRNRIIQDVINFS